MGRATPREIMQSVKDHDTQTADQGTQPSQRRANRGGMTHTSESGKVVIRNEADRAADAARVRFWRTLGKQVAAGARITVR